MSCEETCLGYCLQTFLYVLVIGTWMSFQFVVLPPWLGWHFSGVLVSLIWTSLVVMILINFTKAGFSDPGRVPPGYEPDLENPELDDRADKRQALRYCRKCGVHKPPRSHHCSTCGRCVLKMDHHCPWVNNCVGHFNHKFFILFLFYVVVTGIFLAFMLISRLVYARVLSISVFEGVTMAITSFFVFPMVIGVIFLLGWQLSLVFSNATTIESYEYESEMYLARRTNKNQKWRYPYDFGWRQNLQVTFGRKRWKWLLPTVVDHDGITWYKNPENTAYSSVPSASQSAPSPSNTASF